LRWSRIPSRSVSIAVAIVCLCAFVAATASASSAGRKTTHHVVTYATRATIPLQTAMFDPFTFAGSDFATAFKMTHGAGASYVRIVVAWSGIAPAALYKGFVASDPTSPGYQWGWLDSVVGSAEQAGLTPILDVGSAPSWAIAKAAKAPNAGTPDAKALGDFATALATHYDGLPGADGSVAAPPVHVFQVWNEPNLTLDLSPSSPANYRSMVNSFAAAVHAVDPANLVVAGALDPFGHKPVGKTKWSSMAPLTYMRSLLCLSAGAHPHATCHNPIHFDVWAHHPYTFGGPFAKAKNAGDASLGDLPAMRSVLQTAVKLHHVVSSHPVQFWVTEFGWDTSPPRRGAAPMALAARWTAESLYQMWRSGVSLVTWFDFQDQPGKSTYQSGLYYWNKKLAKAKAKPTRTAFRFPFVAYLAKNRVSVWGRDATSTKTVVTIQMRAGTKGHWRTVARVVANRYGIFKATIKLAATTTDWLRAAAPGSGNSLGFSLTVPKDPHIGPWGTT
jgi:hypothetical protein